MAEMIDIKAGGETRRMTVHEALELGKSRQDAGDLSGAAEIYQQIHNADPKQVEQFLDESVRPPEYLLEIAQFSHAEGEMSLLELLDGVRAYSESFQARNDLLLKYQLSIFELEKAIGIPITGF